jgi:hypothetical protein
MLNEKIIEEKLDKILHGVEQLVMIALRHEDRFDRIDARFDRMDARFDRNEKKLDCFIDETRIWNAKMDARVSNPEDRCNPIHH